jgi:3-hydroxyacyl-CoA dehydrogenase/enoyl-CoA hydratase/3-hydroxybutyryl-CoA epimerase
MPPDSIPPVVRAAGPAPLIECTLDNGVLAAVIDMPGRTMNVFSPELMDALERLIERIRSDGAVRSVVLTSGKPSFIVGADLEMIREFTERAEREPRPAMHELIARLGRLFNQLEQLAKPVVAAINGLALGGGLEICLASTYRVAADDSSVQIGLPEIKLGLLPGAGGTQRLPRLIGIEKGLQLLLSGASVSPKEALELGLLDEVVARDQLIERAKTVARDLATRPITRRYLKPLDPGLFRFAEPQLFETMAAHYGLSQETMETYPAYVAIMRCVVEGASMELTSAVDNEMARFIDLMYDETAGNMVRTLFLDRQRTDNALLDLGTESDFCVVLTATGPAADSIAAALSRAKIDCLLAGGWILSCFRKSTTRWLVLMSEFCSRLPNHTAARLRSWSRVKASTERSRHWHLPAGWVQRRSSTAVRVPCWQLSRTPRPRRKQQGSTDVPSFWPRRSGRHRSATPVTWPTRARPMSPASSAVGFPHMRVGRSPFCDGGARPGLQPKRGGTWTLPRCSWAFRIPLTSISYTT